MKDIEALKKQLNQDKRLTMDDIVDKVERISNKIELQIRQEEE